MVASASYSTLHEFNLNNWTVMTCNRRTSRASLVEMRARNWKNVGVNNDINTFVYITIVQPILYGHHIISYLIRIKPKLNWSDLKITGFSQYENSVIVRW